MAAEYKTKPKWGRMNTKSGVPWKRIYRCVYCYEFVSTTSDVCPQCKSKAAKARDDFFKWLFARRDQYAS